MVRGVAGLNAAPAAAQRGVALAIVVWFIAGMSLLVAGIVAQARVDTHMAQNHLARAVAVAAGDGAIQLMLADKMAAADPDSGGRAQGADGNYRVGAVDTRVVLVPTSGLIDMNGASAEVLSALFQTVGGLPEEEALLLAQNVVQSRTATTGPDAVSGQGPFDVFEDLLRIPGISRTLLDAVRDFIVVGEAAIGASDWSRAPDSVLDVLDKAGDPQAAAVKSRGRDTAGEGGESGPVTGAFRADAIVQFGDKIWLRRRWISMSSSPNSALPWRVIRSEPPRVLMNGDSRLDGSADA